MARGGGNITQARTVEKEEARTRGRRGKNIGINGATDKGVGSGGLVRFTNFATFTSFDTMRLLGVQTSARRATARHIQTCRLSKACGR